MRLASIRTVDEAKFADGVKFGEQALALDPRSEWTRRALIGAYLAIGDLVAARRIAAEPQPALQVRQLDIYVFLRDWRKAGNIAYASAEDGTQMPIDAPAATFAIRMHARATGEYGRARALLERQSGVTWDAAGVPRVPVELGLADQTVALGDVLMQSGERERARRLLAASLRDMDYVARDLKRGELWYLKQRPIALALLGDKEAALTALERAFAAGVGYSRGEETAIDPAFDVLRDTPRFKALVAKNAAHAKDGYAAVEQLRRDHLVPAAAPPR